MCWLLTLLRSLLVDANMTPSYWVQHLIMGLRTQCPVDFAPIGRWEWEQASHIA